MTSKWILAALVAAFSAAAGAQTLAGASIAPRAVAVGQQAALTAKLDSPNGAVNCNVLVHWGDGQTQHFHVNQEKDLAFTLAHTYEKAGTYEVKVEPKTNLPNLKCLGKNQFASVTVQAAAAKKVAATATAAPPAAPQCPEGWNLDRKSVSSKHAGFTCNAKAGTPVAAAPACAGDLTYFHNAKRGQLGCRP